MKKIKEKDSKSNITIQLTSVQRFQLDEVLSYAKANNEIKYSTISGILREVVARKYKQIKNLNYKLTQDRIVEDMLNKTYSVEEINTNEAKEDNPDEPINLAKNDY